MENDFRKDLIKKIKDFRRENKIAKTTFGVLVMKDGNFIDDLVAGRDISASTYQKVTNFISEHTQQLNKAAFTSQREEKPNA